jgi:phospholipid/cholesterol/gamma-HCH transport system substrate-binding protein
MKTQKIALEAKVGLFVLLGLMILFYMSFRIGEMGTKLKGGYQVATVFDSATGLSTGADVDIAGVAVGKVASIELQRDKAKVVMNIKKDVKLGKDALAMIRTHGLMGDKFVSIRPGDTAKGTIPPGGEITKTVPPVDIDQLLSNLGDVAKDLKSVMGTFQNVFGGKKGAKSVRNILDNFEEFSANINKMVKDNSDRITTIVKNFEEFSTKLQSIDKKANSLLDNLVTVSQNLKEGKGTLGKLIVSDEIYNEVKATVGELHKMAAKINGNQGTLGKLVNDDTLYNDAKVAINNLKEITAKINSGQGTLGKLVNDEKLYTEAEKTLRKVQIGMEGLDEQTPIMVISSVFGLFF